MNGRRNILCTMGVRGAPWTTRKRSPVPEPWRRGRPSSQDVLPAAGRPGRSIFDTAAGDLFGSSQRGMHSQMCVQPPCCCDSSHNWSHDQKDARADYVAISDTASSPARTNASTRLVWLLFSYVGYWMPCTPSADGHFHAWSGGFGARKEDQACSATSWISHLGVEEPRGVNELATAIVYRECETET